MIPPGIKFLTMRAKISTNAKWMDDCLLLIFEETTRKQKVAIGITLAYAVETCSRQEFLQKR